jgi:hypothetical protein
MVGVLGIALAAYSPMMNAALSSVRVALSSKNIRYI